MAYALIENGVVVNVIEYDPQHEFDPGEGVSLVQLPDGEGGSGGSNALPTIGWEYRDEAFIPPAIAAQDIETLRSRKLAELTITCGAAIVGGYTSEALGEQHRYPSGLTDQINMMGSVTASLLPVRPEDWSTPFWCCDQAGAWAFRYHDAGQIQVAGSDGKAHVVTCQGTLEYLSAQALSAATADAINAIDWPA